MENTTQNGKLNRKKQYQNSVKSMGSLDFLPCGMHQVSNENLTTGGYGISCPFTEASLDTYKNKSLCGVCWLPVLWMLQKPKAAGFN